MTTPTKVTISHVAEVANVSKMTVSRVLNGQPGVSEQTRQRIMETIESLGYVANPAARVLRGSSRLLGLILPGLSSPYIGEVINGISHAIDRLDYGLMLYTQGRPENTSRTQYYASLLTNGLVDGVLMVVPYDFEFLVEQFNLHELPYVIVDHHGDTGLEPAITATNRKGLIDAMRHLLALGHKRIGFITGRMTIGCSRDRLEGYRNALAEVRIPYDPELVMEGDFEQPTGFAHAQHLLSLSNPPTAIVASNDVMAFGVMDAVKAAGLHVGEDISVVGFDDIPMASQVYPPLTTVRQPMAAMGETAVELLVALLEDRKPMSLIKELPTELIVRQSTGLAPQR
jgi:LacI family transcriptional regulator